MAKIEKNTFEKGYIISLEGQFTGGNETDDLVTKLDEIKKEKDKNLIIDFKDATYLSSIVIGLLVRTKADFQKLGLSVVYCSLNKTLEDVLKMTKVWSLLDTAEDVESAKKMIR